MYKTWIEIDEQAARHNMKIIKGLVRPETMIWAVVKSNAYGHGLLHFAKLTEKLGAQGFCVDSVIEAKKLRGEGILKPILVLGPTHNELMATAVSEDITISISNEADLKHLLESKTKPRFHLKVDTGMHRQGFMIDRLADVFKRINIDKDAQAACTGLFSHFASAKDVNYPSYTETQFKKFESAIECAKQADFKEILFHTSATGGTLLDRRYHLDAVRVGIGLLGYMPSKELEMQLPEISFKPVLSWYALVNDVKEVKEGGYIGYDLVERVSRDTKVAIIPIGYWHGFAWRLSSNGHVVIDNKPARVLGRVSMDIITVDVTDIPCKPGDKAIILNRDYNAYDMARQIGTSHYEVLTQINPLIKRIVI